MTPEQIKKVNEVIGKLNDMYDWCEDDTIQQCISELQDDLTEVIGEENYEELTATFTTLDSYDNEEED
jgi:hypothetical protein